MGFLDHFPIIEEAETLPPPFAVGDDVGLNPCSRESIEGRNEALVVFSASVTVGCDQEIVGFDMYYTADRPVLVYGLDELTDCVNQDVIVPDGSEYLRAFHHTTTSSLAYPSSSLLFYESAKIPPTRWRITVR